jgi:acyl-coenzyme A thioesterase PaaI-like protein
VAAILDCAVGAAGIVHFAGVRAGTVTLTLNFLKPVFGRRITANCWVTRRTGSLLFTEATIWDGANRVCVTGSGTVARVAAKPDAAVAAAPE